VKILNDLLSNLNTTEAIVRDIRQGPFQTAVLTRSCDLASTPHYGEYHRERSPVAESGLLLEKDAKTLAHLALSLSLHEAAIGMATINSLNIIDETQCIKLNPDLALRCISQVATFRQIKGIELLTMLKNNN